MPRLRDALAALRDGSFFDLHESDEAYRFVVDVPGVSPDQLEFTTDDGRITIEGSRGDYIPESAAYVEVNRSTDVEAELPLPSDADPGRAEATTRRGVLELTLPKYGTVETKIDVVEATDDASGTLDEAGDPQRGKRSTDGGDADTGDPVDEGSDGTDSASVGRSDE